MQINAAFFMKIILKFIELVIHGINARLFQKDRTDYG